MMKTLTVKEETWKNLHLMKYAMALDTIDEVIIRLIQSYKADFNKDTKTSNPFRINKEVQDGRV